MMTKGLILLNLALAVGLLCTCIVSHKGTINQEIQIEANDKARAELISEIKKLNKSTQDLKERLSL